MKKDLCEVVFILDRSGSMGIIKNDTVGNFNSFIEEQKKLLGDCDFSLVLFDHEYNLLINKKNIYNVENLTDKTYVPRGNTALLDAIGRTINDVGNRLYNTYEANRPSQVIFVILTDGEENHSKEFTSTQIADMIKHQTDNYSWKFLFLGANQDSFLTSEGLNIDLKNTMNYNGTAGGVKMCYATLNSAITSFRDGNEYSISNDTQDIISNN
jgi:hypothetical protein